MTTLRVLFFGLSVFALLSQSGCMKEKTPSATLDASGPPCPWTSVKNVLLTPNLEAVGNGQSPVDLYTPSPVDSVTADQAKADIACLKLIFERSYAGTEIFKSKGVDLQERASSLANNISAPIKTSDFLSLLFEIHSEVPDSHLAYFLPEEKLLRFVPQQIFESKETFKSLPDGTLQAISNTSLIIKSCPKAYLRPTLSSNHFESNVFIVQSALNLDFIECKTPQGKFNLDLVKTPGTLKLPTGSDKPQLEYLNHDKSLIYARIPSMEEPGSTESDILNALKSTNLKGVILDIRGNGGGKNEFPNDVERIIKSTTEKRANIDSKDWISHISLSGMLNYSFYDWYTAAAKASNSNDLQKVNTSYFPGFDNLFQSFYKPIVSATPFSKVDKSLDGDEDGNGKRQGKWEIPLIILYDQDCASACETLMERLKHHPAVKFAGLPSAGAELISNPSLFVLPASKVHVQLGMRLHIYWGQVNSEETKGHLPDFFIDRSAADAGEILRNCILDPTCLQKVATIEKNINSQ